MSKKKKKHHPEATFLKAWIASIRLIGVFGKLRLDPIQKTSKIDDMTLLCAAYEATEK